MLHGLKSVINESKDGHGSQGEGERVTRMNRMTRMTRMTRKTLLTNEGREMNQIPIDKAMREKREWAAGDDEESARRPKRAKNASEMNLTGGQ